MLANSAKLPCGQRRAKPETEVCRDYIPAAYTRARAWSRHSPDHNASAAMATWCGMKIPRFMRMGSSPIISRIHPRAKARGFFIQSTPDTFPTPKDCGPNRQMPFSHSTFPIANTAFQFSSSVISLACPVGLTAIRYAPLR